MRVIVFIFSMLILSVVCPFPYHHEQLTHKDRLQRRKTFQKGIVDCLLSSNDISTELKKKLEENKDEDLRQIVHLFMNKVNLKDKEIIRKCRREVFQKMRNMFKIRRHDHFMNRTRFRSHLFDHDKLFNNSLIKEKETKNELLTEHNKATTSSAKASASNLRPKESNK